MRRLQLVLAGTLVSVCAPVAVAEDITLTTYYPSPRGVYEELRTLNNTYLATQAGSVGIGTSSPTATLDIQRNDPAISPLLDLQNLDPNAGAGAQLSFALATTAGVELPGGALVVQKAGLWTPGPPTQDTTLSFATRLGGVLAPRVWVDTDGKLHAASPTVPTDPDDVLATKDYVDAAGGGGPTWRMFSGPASGISCGGTGSVTLTCPAGTVVVASGQGTFSGACGTAAQPMLGQLFAYNGPPTSARTFPSMDPGAVYGAILCAK